MSVADPELGRVVRVIRAEGVAGGGVLIDDKTIVTCAHVLGTAHQRARDGDLWVERVVGSTTLHVQTACVGPGPDNTAGDFAVLHVLGSGVDVLPPLGRRSAVPNTAVRCYGFPDGYPDGLWLEAIVGRSLANGTVQLTGHQQLGIRGGPGFSGAPVFETATGCFVGIFAAYDLSRDTDVAFLIPSDALPGHAPAEEPIKLLGRGLEGLPDGPMSRLERFLSDYVGREGSTVPFGGRDRELVELKRWETGSTQRGLLVAPAGRGKSAMMMHWALGAARRGVEVAVLPISVRYQTALKATAVRMLGARLAAISGIHVPVHAGADDWIGVIDTVLRTPRPPNAPLVVIIDGADEAVDWQLGRDLVFPGSLAPNVKVFVSARPVAGRDTAEWLRELGWEEDTATTFGLDRLDPSAVRQIVVRVLDDHGSPAVEDVATELVRLSEGDPLVLHLYLEGVMSPGAAAVAALRELEPGVNGWFSRWFEELDSDLEPGEAKSVTALLDVLAAACGPLSRDDAIAVARPLLDPSQLGRCLRACKRLVIGDGRTQGYALAHPRLAIYLAEERMSATRREEVSARYVTVGLEQLARAEGGRLEPDRMSRYFTQHLAGHLVLARRPIQDLLKLASPARLQAWESLTGTFDGFLQDIHRVFESAAEQRDYIAGARCALIASSLTTLAANLPAELVGALVASGRWTVARALSYSTRVPAEADRLQVFLRAVEVLPDELVDEADRIARELQSEPLRAIAFAAVGGRGRSDLLESAHAMSETMTLLGSRALLLITMAGVVAGSRRRPVVRPGSRGVAERVGEDLGRRQPLLARAGSCRGRWLATRRATPQHPSVPPSA